MFVMYDVALADSPERSGQLGDRVGPWRRLQGNCRLLAESEPQTELTTIHYAWPMIWNVHERNNNAI